MQHVDYLVVGAGLTGAVIARQLSDAGREVLVLERRAHLGGNVHDSTHPSGVRIHTYGPHYFRTSSEQLWAFANRFAIFDKYEAVVLADAAGETARWPIAARYIAGKLGHGWQPAFTGSPRNFEEAALALMPRQIYDRWIKEYNEKQWGLPASQLSAGLCKRLEIRRNDDPRLTPLAKYQGLPRPGYAAWMKNMLAGIDVQTNVDYLRRRAEFQARKILIYTGPIDEYFGFRFGRLQYRAQQRQHRYLPDVAGLAQQTVQINNPTHAGGPHIRTIEWKHLLPPRERSGVRGTVLTTETPFAPRDPNDFEYPFPDESNSRLYARYRKHAQTLPHVMICGRLGEYTYYDMDQAMARALVLAQRLLVQQSETLRAA